MTTLQYTKHETISLRNHPDFSEAWLHDLICNDPTILGLGEVEVVDRERVQENAGRLDILLADSDKNCRYEVEVMLGATDPSHIIRCIEYWDIERRRYPAYDHVAVLIAEEVTSRFLNVMSLMSGTIPLVAIQLNTLKVQDQILLDFVHVLNQTELRRDDKNENGGESVDRNYWETRIGNERLQVCDWVLEMINEKANPQQQLTYKKRHIGLTAGASARNFVYFYPQKSYTQLGAWVSNVEQWLDRLGEAGLSSMSQKTGRVRISLNSSLFEQHKELIRELVHQATEEYQS